MTGRGPKENFQDTHHAVFPDLVHRGAQFMKVHLLYTGTCELSLTILSLNKRLRTKSEV